MNIEALVISALILAAIYIISFRISRKVFSEYMPADDLEEKYFQLMATGAIVGTGVYLLIVVIYIISQMIGIDEHSLFATTLTCAFSFNAIAEATIFFPAAVLYLKHLVKNTNTFTKELETNHKENSSK